MSKVGTKHAAMTFDPVQYLLIEADTLTEQDAALAEWYLVRVWAGTSSTTTAKTFDDFRVEICSAGVLELMHSLPQVVGSEATSNEGLLWFIWHATCLQQPRTPKQD